MADNGVAPSASQFVAWSTRLRAEGFVAVRTGALGERLAAAASRAGYECVQSLALLEHDLDDISPAALPGPGTRPALRRAPNRDDDLAVVDLAAFGPRWGLDGVGLRDVCDATPQHRLRATGDADVPAAFAISGRAARTGFLQRLAVHPDAQRRGMGTELVRDSLRWMRRWRVGRALVNTSVDNEAAMALYLRAGFRLLPGRLGVYEWPA